MSAARGCRVGAGFLVALLLLPVWVAPPAEAASVEVMRWQEPTLGPHLSSSFEIPAAEEYTTYFFGVEGAGEGIPEDTALGWVRVRVISTSQVICTGVVVHPGGELSDVYRTCNLETEHHYDLDWFVHSPDASIVLYGRNDPVA